MNITIHTPAVHLHGDSATDDVLKALARAMTVPPVSVELAADQPAAASTDALVPGTYYSHEGGIYIGMMPARGTVGAYHLFASTTETKASFGPEVEIAGCADHWDGPGNTAALLASGKDHPAAKWCSQYSADGKADWYLPAHAELALAWVVCAGSFNPESWYWSSTQGGRYTAWAQDFEDGYSSTGGKDGRFRVRAFRRSFI